MTPLIREPGENWRLNWIRTGRRRTTDPLIRLIKSIPKRWGAWRLWCLSLVVATPGFATYCSSPQVSESTAISCWTCSKRRISYSAGILTGSVYKDLGLKKSGFPAENICNASVSQLVGYITSTCPINTSVVLRITRCWLWKRTSGVAQPSKCSQRLFCWCAIPKVLLSRNLIGKARATLGLLR